MYVYHLSGEGEIGVCTCTTSLVRERLVYVRVPPLWWEGGGGEIGVRTCTTSLVGGEIGVCTCTTSLVGGEIGVCTCTTSLVGGGGGRLVYVHVLPLW